MPTSSLLPPNASKLEQAIEAGIARLATIDAPIAALVDPWTCPLDKLPWLAWGLSVDTWDPDWSEATKRQAVADSIELHRIKGTRRAVEAVMERYDALLQLIEWHEATPRAAPHTFDVILPMVTADGVAPGGKRATAAFAEALIADIARVQPLREHLRFLQSIDAGGFVGIQAVARVFAMVRQDLDLTTDTSTAWAAYLQTEDGEPLQDGDASYLDTTP